ncbi:MAG: hypothetical protein J5871_04230 [Bacteroidales bacterium]|nr:hypothetical protein [Bacteroidales bacterium]
MAWLFLCACGHKETVVRYVSLDFEAATVKSALPFEDNLVKTLDLLVFRQDGQLEYARHEENGASVKAKLQTGVPYTCFLLSNLPAGFFGEDFMRADDMDAFHASISEALEHGFVMVGSTDCTFESAGKVTVEITHLSSKVQLDGISAAFLQNGLAKLKVSLDKVYLTNVAMDESLLSADTYTPQQWCNCMRLDPALPSSLRPLLLAESSLEIPDSRRVETPCTFYCAPNRFDTVQYDPETGRPLDDGVHVGNTPEWSPRNTRLVLEMTINGIKNYYPVTLPALKGGHCYRIKNLVLLGYGAEDPDKPVGRTRIAFSLEVQGWDYADWQEEEFE